MNYRAIALPIGRLLILISVLMIVPGIADVFARNSDWQVFLVSALVLGTAGLLMTMAFQGEQPPSHFREAILFVNAAWFTFSFAGAVPLALYAGLSIACATLYLLCGMTFFEAVIHSMTTVSTGGFSTSDQSFGQFDGLAVYWVASVFMLGSAVPFLYLIRSIERRHWVKDVQIMLLLAIVAAASISVFLFERFIGHDTPFQMFTFAVFNVVSVITTTGYAANDYLQFGPPVIAIFFVLTFFGGCSGSTSGGFKMFRIAILGSYIQGLFRRMIRPHRVVEPKYQGRAVSNPVLEGVLVFAVLYAGAFAAFSLVYMMLGLDLETALSASITALANVGPGVGDTIGPSGTFQSLPDLAKWFLAVQMILGRLEILAGILLLTPDFWLD